VYFLDRQVLVEVFENTTGCSFVVRDEGLLESALARPRTSFGGQDAYPDLWHKTSALIQSLARNHALVDGNKRTSWLAGMFFLLANDVDVPAVNVDEAEAFVIDVATGVYDGNVLKMAAELRRICGH